MAAATVPRTRRAFARLNKSLDVPNLIDIQRRSFEWSPSPPRAGSARPSTTSRRSRTTPATSRCSSASSSSTSRRPDRRVPREGPHLRAPADRHRRLHQPRDRRDPRAVGLHGRLPVDDRARHLHHQRHRARRRDAARPFPGRLPDGAQGPREAGLRRQPDARPRLLAGARDRQEGQGLRPHRPQAQAADHGAAARDGLRGRRADPARCSTTRTTSATRSSPTPSRRARRRARSSSSSRSSARASRRASRTRARCSTSCSSTPSATTSRASAVTS